MKLVSQSFHGHGRALLTVVLLILFAAAFNTQAQNVGDPSTRDNRESLVKQDPLPLVARTDQSQSQHNAEAYMRLTADKEKRRLLMSERPTISDPLLPSQSSTSGTYVFPTGHKRFKHYVRDAVGPWSLLAIGAAAAVDQWENSPPEWGQGLSGYGKRYASSLGQNVIQQTTSYGLSEALRVDSSFNKSNRTGFGPRLGAALLENVTSRTRTGKRVISAPRLAAFYVGGIVPAVTWYPSRFNYKDGLRAGTYSLLFGFATNVIDEFILHR
jgi:hypothetical protein